MLVNIVSCGGGHGATMYILSSTLFVGGGEESVEMHDNHFDLAYYGEWTGKWTVLILHFSSCYVHSKPFYITCLIHTFIH